MFFHILLIYFTLSCISFSSLAFSPSRHSPWLFFLCFIALAAFFLFQKIFLKPFVNSAKLKTFFNLQLSVFILFYYYFLEIQDTWFPYISSYQSLGIYSLALSLPYLALHLLINSLLKKGPLSEKFFQQARFLLPFFVIHSLLLFLLDAFQTPSLWLFLPFFILAFVFFPHLIALSWSKKGVGKVEKPLIQLCEKLQFHAKGIRTWELLKNTPNAAILGFFSFSRYILFSPLLLQAFSLNEIKAVLVHEIGHQKKNHLFFYPLALLCGFFLSSFCLQIFIYPFLFPFKLLVNFFPTPAIKQLLSLMSHFLLFLIYFRTLFAYFSRAFEREADSYLFQSPVAIKDFQNALLKSAALNGQNPHKPCWHHHGIQTRIDFLSSASNKPLLLQKHQQKVGYLKTLLLIAFTFLIFWQSYSHQPIKSYPIAKNYVFSVLASKLPIQSSEKTIKALNKAYLPYGALEIPGLFEYYSSFYLLQEKEEEAAFKMLERSWNKVYKKAFKKGGFEEYKEKCLQLLEAMPSNHASKKLKKAIKSIP